MASNDITEDYLCGGLWFEAGMEEEEETMARKARSIKQRREIFDDFDWIELHSWPVLSINPGGYYCIDRTDQGYLAQYCVGRGERKKVKASIALEGEDAAHLRSELDKTEAYRWTREFRPADCLVFDGYHWTMDFYKGENYFQTSGGNAAPQELLDLHDYLASLGLPRLEYLDKIAKFGYEATMTSPWDRLE